MLSSTSWVLGVCRALQVLPVNPCPFLLGERRCGGALEEGEAPGAVREQSAPCCCVASCGAAFHGPKLLCPPHTEGTEEQQELSVAEQRRAVHLS